MPEKSKKKTNRGAFWYQLFIGICSVCMIINVILCTVCLFAPSIGSRLHPDTTPDNNKPQVTANDFITVGAIDILSIFATVVAASYLANVINKKDIDNLTNDTNTLKQDLALLRPVVENSENILFNLFIEAIDQSNSDIVSRLLADAFRKEYQCKNPSENLAINYNLIEIEHSYFQVRTRHYSAYEVDESLLLLAEEAEKIIQQLQKEYSARTYWNELVRLYLSNRLAGFTFYRGYCARSKKEGIQPFITAAEMLKKCKKETISTFEKQNHGNKNDIPRLKANYENMIGECYSKVVQYYVDSSSETAHDSKESSPKKIASICQSMRNIFKKTKSDAASSDGAECNSVEQLPINIDGKKSNLGEKIESISSDSIVHCQEACDTFEELKDTLTDTDRAAASVYYRNLGCAYERQDRFNALKNNTSNNYSHYEDIVSAYTKSLKKLHRNTGIDPKSATNTYYTLLSYYKKYWDATRPSDDTSGASTCSAPIEHITNLVQNMNRVGKLAVAEFPRDDRFLCLYGFSCAYAAALIKDGIPFDLPHNDKEYYKEQVAEVYKTGKLLNPKNGYLKVLNYINKQI